MLNARILPAVQGDSSPNGVCQDQVVNCNTNGMAIQKTHPFRISSIL